MTCSSAEELQARLALRALWSEAKASDSTSTNGDSHHDASTLHRRFRSDIDDVLKSGLSRRLHRIENTVNRFIEGGGGGKNADQPKAVTNGSTSPVAAVASASASGSVSEMSAQTNSSGSQDYYAVNESDWGQEAPAAKLAASLKKAYTVQCKATWPRNRKTYGPSRKQKDLEEPPVKEEKLEKELVTIRSTLASLNQNLSSRERQISSLKNQIAVTKEHVKEEQTKLDDLDEILNLVENPQNLSMIHDKRRKRQKENLENVEKELQLVKAEVESHRNLTKQQHAFFTQAETIYCQPNGAERIQRCPAGEVFLAPQPLAMPEEKAESGDAVGTSIANPYEVDSWPFEPNVLARRCPKECPMDNVAEETWEDLLEAQRPARANPFSSGLNLRNLNNDDEDDDEDYDGPSATSRSL